MPERIVGYQKEILIATSHSFPRLGNDSGIINSGASMQLVIFFLYAWRANIEFFV